MFLDDTLIKNDGSINYQVFDINYNKKLYDDKEYELIFSWKRFL